MAPLLAIIGALVFGAADFTGGHATRRTPVATVTLVTNVVGVALAGVLVLLFGGELTRASVLWGAGGGVCGLGGLLLFYLGLAKGPNSLVSPLAAVIAAGVPVVVGIATGDRPDSWAIAGLAITPVAIWLVAGGDVHTAGRARRSLLYAAGAGLGFGLFFTCIAQTPPGSGAVPLLAARLTTTTILLVVAGARRTAPAGAVPISRLALPALAGALDMIGNGFYLWATKSGSLAVVGALISLFPVTTVLLAIVVLHERLTRAQAVGCALAVASAALLS